MPTQVPFRQPPPIAQSHPGCFLLAAAPLSSLHLFIRKDSLEYRLIFVPWIVGFPATPAGLRGFREPFFF